MDLEHTFKSWIVTGIMNQAFGLASYSITIIVDQQPRLSCWTNDLDCHREPTT